MWSPSRLLLQSSCVTVSGTAGCAIRSSEDNDYHLRLLLDPGQGKLLTAGNSVWSCGGGGPRLVVEIIPQRCGPPQPTNCADVAGFTDPPLPPDGAHITVTGPLVLDKSGFQHSLGASTAWAEIHPAWVVTIG